MKKRLRLTFFIAALTAGGIILFQIYWVYNTWQTGRLNFVRTATTALEKSIDAYQLQQNNLPTSLSYKAPYLSFFMRTIPSIDVVALDTPKKAKKFSAEFLTVAVDQNHLAVVKALVANLLSQQLHKPLSLDTLTHIFKKELLKEGISMPFKLIILKKQQRINPEMITATVNFYKSPVMVQAVLDSSQFLLMQNFVPATVSLLLIILSAGSLWYMGIIIKRQMQLDGLKNDFINNITHELRTPIAILKSSNEALAQFGAADEPERLARYLKINETVLDRLDSNVDRVLDIAQYEHGLKIASPEALNLAALIEQVIERFSLSGASITLDYRLTAQQLVTDRFAMETIVTNLVDNALKYTEGEALVKILVTATPAGWQMQVSDNGKGIKEIYLPLIFDKFYRVQSGDVHDVKGYGLGLSYVRQLVNNLNGQISVSSKPGLGTIFTLSFQEVWKK